MKNSKVPLVCLSASVALCVGVISLSASAAPRYSSMTISTTGFGELKVGMTLEEAQKALGDNLKKVSNAADAACFYTPSDEEQLVIRMRAGKVASIDTSSPSVGVTRSGIRVGDPADKPKATYGKDSSYKESNSPFDKRPVVQVGSGKVVVAMAQSDGKVDLIRVGDSSDVWGRCE
jgi:hypothetical protein